MESREYDANGNLIRQIMPEGQETQQYYLVTYNYDAMGNRTVVKRYLDYQSVDSAKGRCHEIHYCYDKSNRLVEVSDSTGAEETYTYDKGGRLRYRRSRIAEGVEQETGYKYDRADRIIEIWERMEKAAGKTYGSNYSKTVYTYDANGNVTQILLPDGGTITYTYDADDRVAEETHAYDLMNREIRYVDGEGGMTTRSYDQDGREPFWIRRGDAGCRNRTVLSAGTVL